MGGLYNMVFGGGMTDANAARLALAGLEEWPERFRDAWLEIDGDRIVVVAHTRLGGGNRPDYAEEWERLRAIPTYISDADETHDATYASIRFAIADDVWAECPDEVRQQIKESAYPEPRDVGAMWDAAIEAIKSAGDAESAGESERA